MKGEDKDPCDGDDRKPPAKVVFLTNNKNNTSISTENSVLSSAATAETSARTAASTPMSSPAQRITRTPPPGRTLAITPQQQQQQHYFYPHDDALTKPLPQPRSYSTTPPRSWLLEEMVLLTGTSLLSIAAFLYVVMPLTALMGLLVFVSSSTMLSYTAMQYARQTIQAIQAGRGIGDYLPAWLMETLTQQTVHELMTDPAFALEYRHLLLYFLPLGEDQRDAFIGRLAPNHLEALQRPGLGNLLGPDFMRIIVGQERLPSSPTTLFLQQQQQLLTAVPEMSNALQPDTVATGVGVATSTSTLVTVANNNDNSDSSRRLLYDSDDSNSDLGLDVTTDDLAGGLDVQQATNMARYLGLGGGAVTDETVVVPVVLAADTNEQQERRSDGTTPVVQDITEREDYAAEEVVLMDALWSAFDYSFWSPVTRFVADSTTPVTRPLFRGTVGLTLLSGGLGIWGYWTGIYSRPVGGLRLEYPSSRSVWATTVVGGVSAGLLLMARSYLRPSSDSSVLQASSSDKKKNP